MFLEEALKIEYDDYVFRMQNHGGISRYFTNLINGFATQNSLGITPVLSSSLPTNWRERLQIETPQRKFVSSFVNTLIETEFLPKTRKSSPNPTHLTYYDRITMPNKFAITVHDFTPEIFPQFFPKGNPHLNKMNLIDQADVIFTVSKTTAEILLSLRPHLENRIHVTYLGSDIDKIELLKLDYTRPYLLAVGRPDEYKNFETLIRAWLKLRDFDLVVFGCDRLPQKLTNLIPENFRNRIHLKQGEDSLLATYYSNAFCYVTSTYSEGFGIPLLESMKLQCPVVASSLPVFDELFKDAYVKCDSNSVSDFISGINSLRNSEFSTSIKNRGLVVSNFFSWEKTLIKTSRGYHNFL
jgi:glycosyltransferase involved in cell wall biosynthesis